MASDPRESAASRRYRAVVIGSSAGGLHALKQVLAALPADFPLPIAIVQHLDAQSGDSLALLLDGHSRIQVREAAEREILQAGSAYLAPANYHLLIESDASLSLSTEAPVCCARPSIDVLFESASEAFGSALIGLILTGANADGSAGLFKLKQRGGLAVVQDPAEAAHAAMPRAALDRVAVDHVLPLQAIGALLCRAAELRA